MPNVRINEIAGMPKFSLGWELEACVRAGSYPVDVQQGSDGSVSGDGMEYKLRPHVVTDVKKGIVLLRKLVSDKSIAVDRTCGFHVHVGYPISGIGDVERSKLWAAWNVNLAREVEEAAFRAVPFSRTQNDFCQAWKRQTITTGIIKARYNPSKYDNARRTWVNIVEMFRPGGIGTVENRLMGETKRFSQLYSWIAFCFEMAQASFRLIEDPSLMSVQIDKLKNILSVIETDIKEKKTGNMTAAKMLGLAAGLPWTNVEKEIVIKDNDKKAMVGAMCNCPDCREMQLAGTARGPVEVEYEAAAEEF